MRRCCSIMYCFCRADLDPIYYCELLDVCAINDSGDAKITDASVMAKSGPQGNCQLR